MDEYEKVSGTKIVSLITLGSKYDMDSLAGVLDDGRQVRIRAETVLKMVNEFDFKLTKARKHLYLDLLES